MKKLLLPIVGGGEYEVRPSKIVALGLNYLEHIKESQSVDVQNFTNEIPTEPILFPKTPNVLIGPEQPIIIPSFLEKYNDGFALAEQDLKTRGEGNVFGTAQSGIVNFSIATIHDTNLIERSKKWVDTILENQKELLTNELKKKIASTETIHWE